MGEARHHYLKGLFVHIYVEEKLTYNPPGLRWLLPSYLNGNRLHSSLEDHFPMPFVYKTRFGRSSSNGKYQPQWRLILCVF